MLYPANINQIQIRDKKLARWSIASCALALASRPSISKNQKQTKKKKKKTQTNAEKNIWTQACCSRIRASNLELIPL